MATYEEIEFRTFKVTEEGERTLLSNFNARIKTEVRVLDGRQTETYLTIAGTAANPDNPKRPHILPEIEVEASAFAGMGWVMPAWGVRAVMQPGSGVKEDLRTAIQLNSRPDRKTIYKSLGWIEDEGERRYLHAGGAIGKDGNDATVAVRLAPELMKFNLAYNGKTTPKEAFAASLAIIDVGPPKLMWTLWSACFAPLFGPVDFAVHVTGRSGTYKSEITSLIQSHYGAEMDARHLPGSWSSTANALEAQAYYAANAIFCIDDFVPVGTSWQIRSYQTGADKIIRGQGNQAGRARLTDTSGMQTTFYPRGLIVSTGEDTPEGHSVRARMMIFEISPGDIDLTNLTWMQKNRQLLPIWTADLIRYLASKEVSVVEKTAKIRDKYIKVGHSRTPAMIGRLVATGHAVLQIAFEKKFLTQDERDTYGKKLADAIIALGNEQHQFLEAADPVELFFSTLRQALTSGHCHIRTLNGGIPLNPGKLGWSSEKSSGAIETYKSHGPCIGWIRWEDDELFLDADNAFAMVKKVAGSEMSLTKNTVWKRLKDAGRLLRTDEGRQRNTVRITAEQHQRQVVATSASEAMDTPEKPDVEGLEA